MRVRRITTASWLAVIAATVVMLWGPSVAHARRLCVKWEIRTEDSGTPVLFGPNAGDTEDKYSGADSGAFASALGVRVKISRPGWVKTYDTEPSTGCITWNDDNAYSGEYSVRVYGYQTDANDNFVRIHDGSNDKCWSQADGRWPTQSYLVEEYTPSGGTDRLDVGDEIARWTTQAMLGYSLFRYHDDVHDKAFHVGFDDSENCGSSAHYGFSNQYITQGRHCLQISDCDDDNDRRWKFIISHEFGHALAALHYGDRSSAVDGSEPNVNTKWVGLTDHAICDYYDGYTINSVEWNSLGFREGMAHFISGRVYNDRVLNGSTGRYEGAFNWMGGGLNPKTQDLQRPKNGSMSTSESLYEDYCCASFGGTCISNSGTIGDWHRFFWDFYTNQGFLGFCTTMPTKKNMLWLYSRTRLQSGLTKSNYFSKMETAVEQMNLPSCLETTMFDIYASNNGIDH